MKKISLFLLIVLSISYNVYSQVDYIEILNEVVTKPCPYRGPVVMSQLKNWVAYQTIDGSLNSDVDSTVSCITSIKQNFSARMDLSKIDARRPLYFRPSSDKNKSFHLSSNAVFNFELSATAESGVFKQSTNCDSTYCNTFSSTMRILAENGIDYISKVEVENADIYNSQFGSTYNVDLCFTTSKIDTQFFEDIIVTMVFDSTALSKNPFILFNGFGGSEFVWVDTLSTDLIVNSNLVSNGILDISLWDLEGFSESIFIIHSKEGYPSANNIDTKYLKLVPNLSTKTIINLTINEFQNLYIQDFVQISPELVEGSDSIYHEFNLIQDGGDVCLLLVERLLQNTNYIYRKGNFDIDGSSACLMIYEGSKLIIDTNAEMKYGNNGNGILALNDGVVEINEKGKLIFDGKIFLRSQNEKHSTIILKTDAELIFTSDASIINRIRENEKLLIKGFPYQVDMTNLKQEYRDKIVFEIPEVDKKSELVIYPNPAIDNRIHVPSKYNNTDYSIHNLSGRIIQSGIIQNSTINLSNLKSEVMILKIGNEFAKIISF